MTIVPLAWGLSLTEFRKWCADRGAPISRVKHNDPVYIDRAEEFYFDIDEDLVAFKLTFKKREHPIFVGYRGKVIMDVGIINCPYIPTFIRKENESNN